MALFIRTIGLGRATVKIGIANLVYNFRRLIWLERANCSRIAPKPPHISAFSAKIASSAPKECRFSTRAVLSPPSTPVQTWFIEVFIRKARLPHISFRKFDELPEVRCDRSGVGSVNSAAGSLRSKPCVLELAGRAPRPVL